MSALQAPIRMLFHTRFVVLALLGTQKAELLGDPIAMSLLHGGVWSSLGAHALWTGGA